ncbi:PPM1D [Lepeophtheirus salmonis]|uniref:PPM1D n=1 Tax=Lepeophtheirus salmonis TaxID=72036 RepID=A0A7R8CU50_LEPSM|nr:PPM1D [Lepeophtheirus salmonis]CAF2930513.1 PPM1D [Lepeophtheirus salmonis]
MAPSIGLNLRVTGYCNQGGSTRGGAVCKGAFNGLHCSSKKGFWGSDDEGILKAIHDGFIQTHQAMWKELESWPRTASGLPSTAGTTASIAFIRRSKIYIGHVGDSAIVLGVQDPENPNVWRCEPLTKDHKPESVEESLRITRSGGKVICKSGVPRVVWNRPKMGHKGPIRRSTPIDEIPFLAVATFFRHFETSLFILATDGAWNMISPQQAVSHVCQAEKANEQHTLNPSLIRQWINPSKHLVDKAIERWNLNNLRADNTSVVTVMLDPPGPPRALVLKRQGRELAQLNNTNSNIVDAASSARGSVALVTNTTPEDLGVPSTPLLPPPPPNSTPLPLASSTVPGNNKYLKTRSNGLIGAPENQDDENLVQPESKLLKNLQSNEKCQDKNVPSALSGSNNSSQTTTTKSPSGSSSPCDGAIQCNEISSSDESPSNNRSLKQRVLFKKPLKESCISRELNALKMDSQGVQLRRRLKKHNSESSSNSSDTENEEHSINRPPQKRILRSSSILPSSEFSTLASSCSSPCKKKKTTHEVHRKHSEGEEGEDEGNTHFLRSSRKSPLRGQKRKLRGQFELPTPSKSLNNNIVLATKQPVVTRSKSARVLQIKK